MLLIGDINSRWSAKVGHSGTFCLWEGSGEGGGLRCSKIENVPGTLVLNDP